MNGWRDDWRPKSIPVGRHDTCGITRRPWSAWSSAWARASRWASGANGGWGHLGQDVEDARSALEGVQVLGERLPLPVDALVESSAGNVLDALHQLDQERLAALANGGEADAAIAHHDGGGAVPARR